VKWTRLTDVCEWYWEDITNSVCIENTGRIGGNEVVVSRQISFMFTAREVAYAVPETTARGRTR